MILIFFYVLGSKNIFIPFHTVENKKGAFTNISAPKHSG